jgi:hypothetical protein
MTGSGAAAVDWRAEISRLLLPFRRLRWQLTLSYILITLVAALTLEVATTVASVVNPPKTSSPTPAEILVNAMFFAEPNRASRTTHQTNAAHRLDNCLGAGIHLQ